MARLSKLVVICLRVELFTAALMALFAIRAAQVEKSLAAAETRGAERNDIDALGGWQLVGPDTIGEGRSAMNEIFKRRHAVRSFQAQNISQPRQRVLEA